MSVWVLSRLLFMYFVIFSQENRTCVTCQLFKCLSCIDGPQCSSCQPGYFLNTTVNQCFECIFPCVECVPNGTLCTKCPSSLLYSLNTTSNTCDLCFHTLSNCLKCDQAGIQCYQCISTLFYLDPLTKSCVPCISPCLNCIDNTKCLSCVNNTYHYQWTSNECVLCSTLIPRCDTCLQPKVCTACTTTGGTYFLAFPPSKILSQIKGSCLTCQEARPNCLNCSETAGVGPTCDICEDKFYVNNYACFPCPPSCSLCTSNTICTACINTTFVLNNQMCARCNSLINNCLQCSSANVCAICGNNTIPDLNGQCSSCAITQYPDVTNQVCQPCVAPCYSCLNQDDCLTCNQFYEYNHATKRCTDVCGDGVVMTDQCDNTLGIINDGCSDTCHQEPDFTCVLNLDTVSGQSVQRSICSYNLKVNITLKQIVKEPFKNILTWTYLITPFLYGLPGTISRDFTSQELKNIFVLFDVKYVQNNVSSLNIESVSVNAPTSEVSVAFSYNQDIKESDIDLMVNFTYLKSTLNIQNFTTTPDSQKVIKGFSYYPESLIGKFYTDEQYSLASTLNKFALLISIMSFVAFIIGIFSKKLVGLQMVMLCQFAYISLFYYEGILELPLFALKSLVFSTGYNLPLGNTIYTINHKDPPQSFTLGFDATTFSNNFNLMGLLYILPFLVVIPFIPMKAKCIRRLSWIEMGHKWVDLLLGEIILYIVLFNLQYFLFGLIVFYQNGTNIREYLSSMLVSLGCLLTFCSILGLVFKPEIYGNFRTSFKFDDELRSEVIQSKEKFTKNQELISKKFSGSFNWQRCKNLIQKFNLFVNENYFWKNYRTFHLTITFNHYVILSIYFILEMLTLTLVKTSWVINLVLSVIVLIELVLMRPYSKVSQKTRAIYFFFVFTMISIIRYLNNHILQGQFNLALSVSLLGLLSVALVWTYITLIHYFYLYFSEQFSDRKAKVNKVFQIETDHFDKNDATQKEDVLMRKLMNRYQRVELQFNFNNARNQLLTGYDSVNEDKPFGKVTQITKMMYQNQDNKQSLVKKQVLEQMQEENNFKRLKLEVMKQKKKLKKKFMQKRVTGQKMLKLLNMDNFNKYEEEFLMSDQEKLAFKKQKSVQEENQVALQNIQQREDESKKGDNNGQSRKIDLQKNEADNEQKDSPQDYKYEYDSVEPQNIEEAKQKTEEEKILLEQNQFIRYARAKQIITNQGLTIDHELIANNFDRI